MLLSALRNARFELFYGLPTARGKGLVQLGGTCAWTIEPRELIAGIASLLNLRAR